MTRVLAVVLMMLSTVAVAQQPSPLDQAANTLAQERQAGNNLVSLREQQLTVVLAERDALKKQLDETKKDAEKCKPKDDKK